MSTQYPDLQNTLYPNIIDEQSNNTTMSYREDLKDYVLAKDFNTLRDCVLAIERILGSMPQGTYGTIKARIEALEVDKTPEYDARYGGPGWRDLATKPTILSHRHNGDGVTAPNKIDLTQEVTGQLPKTNIKLSGDNSLTASDILVSDGVSIATALNNKLNTTGGTINGSLTVSQNLTVNQKVKTRINFEADATDLTVLSGGTLVTLSDAWLGKAIKNNTKNAAAPGSKVYAFEVICANLRYNDYVAIYRVKVSNVPSDLNLDLFYLEVAGTNTVQTKAIKAGRVSAGWNSVCLEFKHEKALGDTLKFSLSYNTTIPIDIWCDGIVVVPIHSAVWA